MTEDELARTIAQARRFCGPDSLIVPTDFCRAVVHLADCVKKLEDRSEDIPRIVLDILAENRPGAALNAVVEDYPEVAALFVDVRAATRREELLHLANKTGNPAPPAPHLVE